MPKVVYNSNRFKKEDLLLKDFYKGLSLLKDEVKVQNFLEGILTKSERVMVSRRLRIARMLLRRKTYNEIIVEIEVGRSTIRAVDNWLNEGLTGYRDIIKKSDKKAKINNTALDYGEDMVGSFSHLADRFPAHFWLLRKIFGK